MWLRVSLLCLLTGCARRGREEVVSIDTMLARADEAWDQRDELGLDGASAVLLEAWRVAPNHAGVAWRLARWRIAEGLVSDEPGVARNAFAEARAQAVRCLEGDVLFAQRRAIEGWAAALPDLAAERQPCVAWAALSWVRWLEVHGAAAGALDLEAIDALIAAAPTSERDVVDWAAGLAAAVRPRWAGQDLVVGRAKLEAVVRDEPTSSVRLADLLNVVVLPQGDVEEAARLRTRLLAHESRYPEDIAARSRAASD